MQAGMPLCWSNSQQSLIKLQGPPPLSAPLHSSHFCPLQDENEDSSRSQEVLKERLGRLQALCLQLEDGKQQQQPAAGSRSPGSCARFSKQQQQQERQPPADVLERLSCSLRALAPANGAVDAGLPGAKPPQPLVPSKVRVQKPGENCTLPALHQASLAWMGRCNQMQ